MEGWHHQVPEIYVQPISELELELIQIQMAHKPMLRTEVHARALRASQNMKKAEVWVGARCALWVGGAWASAGVEGARMGWRNL
jgi:hypothetical protein